MIVVLRESLAFRSAEKAVPRLRSKACFTKLKANLVIFVKPSPQPITFLDENGVKITSAQITVTGHDFPLRQIHNVAVNRQIPNPVAALLGKSKLKFVLSISTLSDQTMKPVLETEDSEFMQRIHQAIGKAGQSYGAKVTRGVPRR